MLSGTLDLLETSNGNSLTDYRGRNRNYGFFATLTPRARFSFDVAYDYSQQNALICFNDTAPAGVTLAVVTDTGSCSGNDPNNPLLTNGYYANNSHYGMGALSFKPVKRVTALVG